MVGKQDKHKLVKQNRLWGGRMKIHEPGLSHSKNGRHRVLIVIWDVRGFHFEFCRL